MIPLDYRILARLYRCCDIFYDELVSFKKLHDMSDIIYLYRKIKFLESEKFIIIIKKKNKLFLQLTEKGKFVSIRIMEIENFLLENKEKNKIK